MAKNKNRFGELKVPSQAPEANLPITSRVNQANKGPTSPRGGKPKMIPQCD